MPSDISKQESSRVHKEFLAVGEGSVFLINQKGKITKEGMIAKSIS